jgi:quercetin dioxygenase-like cupin family protein
MSETLQRLRELTDRLPILSSSTCEIHASRVVYQTECGYAEGTLLFNSSDISAHRVKLLAGTMMPVNDCKQTRVLVVLQGSLYRLTEQGRKKLSQGSTVILRPESAPKLEAATDSEVVMITIQR